jgi:hypothetical protein
MAKVGPRRLTIGHELVLPSKGQPCHILHPNNLKGGMGHAGLLLSCREGLKWGVGVTVALKKNGQQHRWIWAATATTATAATRA